MRRVIAFALAAAIPLAAQVPPPAMDTSATPASLAGKWTVSVTSSVGARPFSLEITPDPKSARRFTGTLSSMVSKDAVEGEIAEGKLTFRFGSADPSGKPVTVTFSGTALKDGSLTGSANLGWGSAMPWTATRDKK